MPDTIRPSICPLCSTLITGRSQITKLEPPIRPRGDGRFSYDDGGAYYADGRHIFPGLCSWAHERCVPRLAIAPRWESDGYGGVRPASLTASTSRA